MSNYIKKNSESFAIPKVDTSFKTSMEPGSNLNSHAREFTPSFSVKSLSASAIDFQPVTPPPPVINPNLKADAPVFVMSFDPPKSIATIPEFIPEHIPDEKYDEPIFIIQNRELTEDDLNIHIIDEVVKVDVKNIYLYEEILNIYKEIRQFPNFEKITDNIKQFASREITIYRTKNHKKAKENNKNNKDWRELEDAEIVSTTVWRKPKTEEEEKIIQRAKMYKAKLTGTKEEHEKIKRKIKITLNKLSPTNLEKLKEQLLEIGKESTNNLIFLVQCIFEKA